MLAVLISPAAMAAATDSAVVSGQARFEVLSPTLIRTEYAADGQFLDTATFNAIGRDAFDRPAFTTSTVDGWLSIKTAALTMKYKVGSGPFTRQNLSVELLAGTELVKGRPWSRLLCTVGQRCEAEKAARNLSFSGLSINANHRGYTGEGFLAGYVNVGDTLTLEVDVERAGAYQFALQYANGIPADGQHQVRTLTLSVDGAAGRSLSLAPTADWDTWGTARSAAIELRPGRHTIRLARGQGDSGNVNVDSVALVQDGASLPAAGCQFGTVCQAEDGAIAGSAQVQANHDGYGGAGFVAELNQGASVAVQVTDVPEAGKYVLQLRYANGSGGDQLHQARTASVIANGIEQRLSLPRTDHWAAWNVAASEPVALHAGTNDLLIACPDAASCHINVDTVAVLRPALGGYRRSVDLIDGVAPTTPGLLYRDGWYLLDDTATALYADGAPSLTQRPARSAQDYQDGYLFGYGRNYKQALADLATLTGPSVLLPRWAYGVWLSQYYDRTSAMYQNTILPRFRAERVPLDVLVTDTDFKSPNTWNGWEFDTEKFPQPKAFLDWAHGQGLHTSFNIHPSIAGSDPQFPRAQATANNKLARTGACGDPANRDPAGCYGFDWADPDQLAAYFELHQTMNGQGVDFWWLDFCCDGSQSRRTDLTADAWINHHYAQDAERAIGRGFTLSRTYGLGPWNNQPNEASGPWADKRSTVHFTGDSYSTWRMLAAEVGYTAAESAATGLSAVSHDIGGFNRVAQAAGAEPGSYKMDDEMYARWVQFGTFQPIDRLHGDHSDRLPWQYGAAAKASAVKFLRLRGALVPYIYTLARDTVRTGVPVVRALYLDYPDQAAAYSFAGSQYFFGPDLLVAPITSAGNPASVSVWFPPGKWVDYFTGKSHVGGVRSVSADLNTMPVFLRAGAIVPSRADNAPNDVQHPLSSVVLTVASGASGQFELYEDNGSTTDLSESATTTIAYSEAGGYNLLIGPAKGTFPGQVTQRAWTAVFLNAAPPQAVTVNGTTLPNSAWSYNSDTKKLMVPVAARATSEKILVSYR
ncbi:MAG TPA: TIM-barrel domain-containing protein [Telluria sp.]|jgi:hypothetical protein